MNKKDMYSSLNKGIPNYIPITLDIKTLIKECSESEDLSIEEFKQIGNAHQAIIAKIASMTKAERFFFQKLQLCTDTRTSETRIFISSETFLAQLQTILNVRGTFPGKKSLIARLRQKANRLFYIKTEDELKKEFPLIYEDYLLAISAKERIQLLTPIKSREIIRQQWLFYNMYGLNSNFNLFMNSQRIMYRNLTSRCQKIESEAYSRPINLNYFKSINKTKFELYLANKYLEYALNTTNIKEKQECIYYLCTYLRETKYTPITIKDENGNTLTFDKISKGYRRLFKKHIELKPADEDRCKFIGLNIEQVKTHVNQHYNNGISWQILPKGHDNSKLNSTVIECFNKAFRHLTSKEREEAIRKAYDLYERKINFFENTDYIEKIYGLGEFSGYMAYFYANGEVLMEKFFDDYSESQPAKNEAIYNLKAIDFEVLSRLSKIRLMKDSRCKRIIHAGKWEDKLKDIVESNVTEESRIEVQKVLTKIKTFSIK